jgi:hypothetical protein
MKSKSGAWSLFTWLFALSLAAPASAFVRSKDSKTGACLWWQNRALTYYVNDACSKDVPLNSCQAAVEASGQAWNQPECTDLRFTYKGTTPRTDVGFDQNNWNNNINLLIWQETNWTHDRRAIALTTTTYDTETGKVVDADIEFNGKYFAFSTSDTAVRTDIRNTLTHELGHFFGLDHNNLPDSTMYANADEGETIKRDLSQDDIDGECYIYPLGEKTPMCTASQSESTSKKGCSCGALSAGAADLGASGPWLFGIGAWALIRLRRRSRA